MKTINFQNALVSASAFVKKAKTVLKSALFNISLVYLLFVILIPTSDLTLLELRSFLSQFTIIGFIDSVINFSLQSELVHVEKMLSFFTVALFILAGKNFYCVVTSLFLRLTEFVGYKNKRYLHQGTGKYKESDFKGIQFEAGQILGEVVTFTLAVVVYGYLAGGLVYLLNGVIFLKACYFGLYIILTNEIWVKRFFKGIGINIS